MERVFLAGQKLTKAAQEKQPSKVTNPELNSMKQNWNLNEKLKNGYKTALNVGIYRKEKKKIRKRRSVQAEPNIPKITNFFKRNQVGVEFDKKLGVVGVGKEKTDQVTQTSGGGEAQTALQEGVGVEGIRKTEAKF